MKGQFVDLYASADYLGPGAIEIDRYQTEIFDIVRRRGAFGQRIKQVPATGHPSRFFEETAINCADGDAGICRSAKHCADGGIADACGAGGAAEGAGVADQLQPVRSGSDGATKPVRLLAGEGPGRFGGRTAAHARCCAVERQRHVTQFADDAAVFRRDRTDCGGREHDDDRNHCKHRGWHQEHDRCTWFRVRRMRCGQRRFIPTRCYWT